MSRCALEALAGGSVAIVATDTVIGLAALPGSAGYHDIFALKNRPQDQTLPWLVADASALDQFACDVPAYAHNLVKMFWPGALTVVLRASQQARALGGVADDGTLAFRCPDAPQLLELLEKIGSPLACTSANKHGMRAATTPNEVPADMRGVAGFDELAFVQGARQASTIVDCTGEIPKILRQGPISEQLVLNVAFYGATLP